MELIKQIQKLILGGLVAFILITPSFALAQKTGLYIPASDNYGDIIAPAAGQTGEEQALSFIDGALRNVKAIAGALAIAIILLLALRMLLAQGNEEEIKKFRTGMLWTIIGLALISLAADVGAILGPQNGGFIKDPSTLLTRVQLFDYKVNIVITFIKYILGSIAIVFILRNGLRLITTSANEDEVTQDKKNLVASAIGLVLIYVADIFINKVIYKVDKSAYPSVTGVVPGLDPATGIKELVGFTNFAVYLTAPLAVTVLIAGGILYVTAAGDDDKVGRAKRMIISAIIGLVVIYGAFAIVNTFIPESTTVQLTQ